MNTTNLIQLARAKKLNSVLTYLRSAFKDFAYPVYLFGSYATGKFHGYSDVDILVISPDVLSVDVHRLACDRMTELNMNYDILIAPSLNSLNRSIVGSLQTIHLPLQANFPAEKPSRQLGMTLIEIMVALLIGAFLMAGVLQIFVSSKQTNRMQENLSRVQENGRFALNFISKDVRRAGYWGCLRSSSPDIDIVGTDNNTASGDNIDDGTDTLTLRGAFVQPPTGTCGSVINIAAAYYTDPSSTITYQINGSDLQQNTNNQNNKLIEGIQDIQILYGIDTNDDDDGIATTPAPDGPANYYVTAANIPDLDDGTPTGAPDGNPDWYRVISIRISLLAVTLDDNLAAQPLTYTYNGVTTTATDLRIRRVFNTTIALRNRLP